MIEALELYLSGVSRTFYLRKHFSDKNVIELGSYNAVIAGGNVRVDKEKWTRN